MNAFKLLPLPFLAGTKTVVRQGAFGTSSHNEYGNQYNWDFSVPFGTSVVSVEDGIVIDVWMPEGGSGCDSRFANSAHNIKIEAKDGTVAQYVHCDSTVKVGQQVKRGQIIATTPANGWICYPHLHFGVYASRDTFYSSPNRKTVPVFFDAVPAGLAIEGRQFLTP